MLKTSWKQRVVIMVIALLLLGSTVIAYVSIVLGNGSADSKRTALLNRLQDEYTAKNLQIEAAGERISPQYFDLVKSYLTNVKAYNSASANNGGLNITDLKVGTGEQITKDTDDYEAYYIGWCADGTVFDSSIKYAEEDTDQHDPLRLKTSLTHSEDLIAGWKEGVIGMKVGGIRQITIPGELAYGNTQQICGGYNSPLRFIIFMVEPDSELMQLREDKVNLELQIMLAYYGDNL